MTVFITGATGYIGQKLALHLAENGWLVNALVRDENKGKTLLSHPNIVLFEGDILDAKSIKKALQGCDEVYHLAALASVWNKFPGAFYNVNVMGLKNVLDCCMELNIKNIVFTSTAGVVGHSMDGKPVSECTNSNPELETDYKKSKVEAEKVIKNYCKLGLNGIIVNPSRVYGPGLATEINGFTRLKFTYRHASGSGISPHF